MTVTAHQPARFARAVRAACNAEPWEPGCPFPDCQNPGTAICWFALDLNAVTAAIEAWEKPQHLGDPA